MGNTKQLWTIDPTHSEIGFKVKHMMISTVSGAFTDFDGSVKTDNEKFIDADFNFIAKVNSIHTKNEVRDAHLRSADFFDEENYPELKFQSKSFDGDTMIGDLTLKNTTKEIELDVDFNGIAVDPYGNTKAGFEISGVINRKDFDLSWSAVTEAGSIVVSDKVKLVIDLQFVKQ